jgi:hypothetical protein
MKFFQDEEVKKDKNVFILNKANKKPGAISEDPEE